MKRNKIILSAFVSLFSTLLVINAGFSNVNASTNVFDYSYKDSQHYNKHSAKDLIENITKKEISPAESEYLKQFDTVLKYDDKIPSSNVFTSLDDGILTIKASIYNYEDVNNNTVSWIPYSVNFNGNTRMFDSTYQCIFESVPDNLEEFEITYKTTFNLDNQIVNEWLNKAYNVANYYVSNNIIENGMAKYEQEYNEYLVNLDLYNKYLIDKNQYVKDVVKYENYLVEKEKYDDKKAEYDRYLANLEKYNNELNLYQQYLEDLENYQINIEKYNVYLQELESYKKELAIYNNEYSEYLGYMKYIDFQLGAMDLINTPMTSLERTVYSAVMGDTVTKVLSRKDELKIAGVPGSVIDDANDATIQLKSLLPGYFNLTNPKDKYVYYKANYRKILDNTEKLLRSLDYLFRNRVVISAINTIYPDYKDKFIILIAQLALVSNALDDKAVKTYEGQKNSTNSKDQLYFDSTWKINGKSMKTILENDYTFTDLNIANQFVPFYPTKPVEPIKPEEVKEPSKPNLVVKPTKPEEIINPGVGPEVVNKPTMPQEIKEPTKPEQFVVDPIVVALIEDYNNNVLTYREQLNDLFNYEVYTSFSKKFKNQEFLSIEFNDLNGNLLDKAYVENGSSAIYTGQQPKKAADQMYSYYKFSHWEYLDGTILNLNCVEREGIVYPCFDGVLLQKYNVKWIVNDIETIEKYEYGSTPVYTGSVTKPIDGNKYYTFIGWDKEIEEVTKGVTYTAIFEENYLINDGDKFATVNYLDDFVYIDISKYDSFELNVSKLFEHIIKDNNYRYIHIKHNDNFIKLDLNDFDEEVKNNIAVIDVDYLTKAENEYDLSITIYDKKGLKIKNEIPIDIDFVGDFVVNKTDLYVVDDNLNNTIVDSIITKNSIKSTINTNNKYIVFAQYSINVLTNEYVIVEINKTNAKKGEIVYFSTKSNKVGIELGEVSITLANGESIDSSNNQFIMPAEDVYFFVSYTFINYTVNFYVDDTLISSIKYKYGDTISVPLNPTKASDEHFTYEFVGWNNEIDIVTGNVDYIAIFEAIPIVIDPIEPPAIIEPEEDNNHAWIIVVCSVGVVALVLAIYAFLKKKVLLKK